MRNFTKSFFAIFIMLGISFAANAQKVQQVTQPKDSSFRPIEPATGQMIQSGAVKTQNNSPISITPVQKQDQPKEATAIVNQQQIKTTYKKSPASNKSTVVNSDGFISKSVKAYKPQAQIQ